MIQQTAKLAFAFQLANHATSAIVFVSCSLFKAILNLYILVSFIFYTIIYLQCQYREHRVLRSVQKLAENILNIIK